MTKANRTGWDDPAWRRWRIESIRRSLAMVRSGMPSGLGRDEAMQLVEEVQRIDDQLRHLRDELRRLIEDEA